MSRFIRALLAYSVFSFFVLFEPPATFAQYDVATASPFERSATHPRPWDLSIRAFIGYQDNVPMISHLTTCNTPFGGPCAKQSFYGGVTINGSYRFIQSDEWLAGVGLSFDQVGYTHSVIGPANGSTDPHDYNLTAVSPNVFARYFFGFQVGGQIMPASAGMTYSYRREWLPIVGPLLWHTSINTWKWDLALDPIRQLRLGLDYSLSLSDFNPVQATDARDATGHAIGLSGTYSFQGGLRTLTLGYQHAITDGRGTHFDVPNSNGVKAQFKTRVYGPLWLTLDAGSTWANYKSSGFTGIGFMTPPARKWQRVEEYGPTLLYVLTDHITVDLFYRYTGWVSNQRVFEAHRNNGGTGVTYKF